MDKMLPFMFLFSMIIPIFGLFDPELVKPIVFRSLGLLFISIIIFIGKGYHNMD
jgi:hypothetical protein